MPHVDRLYIYIDYVVYEGILIYVGQNANLWDVYFMLIFGYKATTNCMNTLLRSMLILICVLYLFIIIPPYLTEIDTFVFTHTFNWRYAMFVVHPHICFVFHATSVKYIKQTFAMNRYTPLQLVNSMGIPVSNKYISWCNIVIYQLCTWIVGQKVSPKNSQKNDNKSSLQTVEILVAARISMLQRHSDSVLVHFVYIDHQTHTAQVCWSSLFL